MGKASYVPAPPDPKGAVMAVCEHCGSEHKVGAGPNCANCGAPVKAGKIAGNRT